MPLIWTAVTASLAITEITLVGTFFLAPFLLGGLLATITAFITTGIIPSIVVFGIGSVIGYFLLIPLSKKLNSIPSAEPTGVERLIGAEGLVIQPISAIANTGQIRVQSEVWRAATANSEEMPVGVTAKVLRIEGTRLIVEGKKAEVL